MKPRLDHISRRPLPGSGYLLRWEDGFELTVNDDFGRELEHGLGHAHDLREAHELHERQMMKPGRQFTDAQIDEIEREIGKRFSKWARLR